MSKFVHLHVHSHYSLLSGLAQIKPLVKAAKERGFDALALTDYGALYGAIEFYQACKDEGIKPIIGFEAFVAPRSRHDKDREKDTGYHHLILLAENYEGYRNLMQLSSIGQTEGLFDGKPRVDREAIRQFGKSVIGLSGPMYGEIPILLKEGKMDAAKRVALEYNEIFGQDNFYLELEDHPAIEGQMDVNTKLIQLSKETGIPLVATRDVHYLNPDDAEAQDILRCIREGWKVNQPHRSDYRHVDRSLNSAEDIASRFRHAPEAIENTVKIAERVNVEIELDQWHFAHVALPEGTSADEVLREMTYANVEKFMEVTPEVRERLEYELGIIIQKGYAPYFLCVADYVKYAKDHGIIETTRGSAAGSLVSYAIGITTVDPIRFKIPFERFLNPFRPSPPDIDTDFADDRRDEMIAYVTNKYGEDKVAQIITFGTMMARGSVRDVGRALGLSYSFCDQVAKLIPFGSQGFPMTIERALTDEPDLKKLYGSNADVKRLLDLAQKVEGCARHTSIHAAGVVIAPSPLTDFTPIQRETGGEKIVTQYEMHSVESAGLLKMDFLGIRNLSILGGAVEIVEKTTGERIDIYAVPLDDKKTFDMLSRGETMGTFQLGGSGMTRWIKELKPTSVNDIMAMIALFRPGPMANIPEYIARKHGKRPITYYHPKMEKFLDQSFGLLVYQEDLLLTAIELAGYDWKTVDALRKAVGKKIPAEMARQHDIFVAGCRTASGIGRAEAEMIWNLFEPFQGYGFNKAHAASYGIVAYQTAYMKANYPVQYMTAVLQAEAGDADKVAPIVHECKRMGIEVLPPDVNESFRNFAMIADKIQDTWNKIQETRNKQETRNVSVEVPQGLKEDKIREDQASTAEQSHGRIRFGLSAIKNVGEHVCEVIYRERKEHGQYASLEDFLTRIQDKDLNKKSLESLIQAGALDSFGYDRGVLLANIENLLFFVRQTRERETTKQDSLFAGTAIALDAHVTLKDAPIATMDQKLKWEKELLGLYVSSHPFEYFQTVLEKIAVPLAQLAEHARDAWVVVGGIAGGLKKKITKRGEVMLFATIEDVTGSVELLVFPKTYEKTTALWREGNVLLVVGRTPKEDGDNKVFVERASELTKQNAEQIARELSFGMSVRDYAPQMQEEKTVQISLSKQEMKQSAGALKHLFSEYPGEYQVYVRVGENKIKAQSRIDWNSEVLDKLESVVGEGKVEVYE